MMLQNFILAFVAVFVALDVIGTLPMYIGMTQRMSRIDRNQILNRSMAVAFAVAIAFLTLGEKLFSYMGIMLFDFKIAGGVILLLVSLADLVGQPEVVNRASGSTGIVPLAVPLITGPGVIATLILQAQAVGFVITILALLCNYVLAWILLHQSEWITGKIGKDGTVVISKIAALLLAAIAVAMIRGGVFGAIAAYQSER